MAAPTTMAPNVDDDRVEHGHRAVLATASYNTAWRSRGNKVTDVRKLGEVAVFQYGAGVASERAARRCHFAPHRSSTGQANWRNDSV